MKLVFLTLTAFLFIIISKLGQNVQPEKVTHRIPVAQVKILQ